MTHISGLHSNVSATVNAMPTANRKDFEKHNFSSRQSSRTRKSERKLFYAKVSSKKITPVKIFLLKIPAQFDKVLTSKIEQSPLYHPFLEIGTDFTDDVKADLRAKAKLVIETKAYPALRKMKAFVDKEYLPGAQDSIAMSDLPNGKAWYAFLVKEHTTTSLTPDQLFELGQKEVARIASEMSNIRNQLHFKGDAREFHKFLLSDKQFFLR